MVTGTPQRRHTLLVVVNFAAVYVLWGSTYLAIRFGVRDLPPALMAGTRFSIAGAMMLAYLLLRRVPLPPRRLLGPIALTGVLLLFCGNFLVTWSELTVPSGKAAVIIANLPFFIVGLEALRKDGERLSALVVAGLLLGLAGMLTLMWPQIAAAGASGLHGVRGELALLAACLCWATGSVYSKHRIKGVVPLMAVALEMSVAGVGLLLLGLLLGEAPAFHLTVRSAAAVGWLIVAGSLLGFSAYIWLLSHVPAAKVATYAYVNPVIAVLLGWLVLDEVVEARMILGTAIILSGVALVNFARIVRRT